MGAFSHVDLPASGAFGFRPAILPAAGMRRTMAAIGRLPVGDGRPTHRHRGEEVLCIIEGRLDVRVGADRQACGPGDVVAVSASTWHSILVVAETVLVVLTERGMGNIYPVRDQDGTQREVETYRRDVPWSAEPPTGTWTTDEELAHIMASIDTTV